MSNSAGAGDEEEEEEEEEGSSSSSEAEEFYESLDRILSSSCSSTSASSEDDSFTTTPAAGSSHHRSRHHHRRSSPPSLDVWVAEPAPVQERRRRLLEQLGLSNDHSLARHTGVLTAGEVDVARSVPCDSYLCSAPAAANAGCMGRSRSDNSVDPVRSVGEANSPPLPPGDRSKPPLVMQFRSASSDSIEVVEEFRERRAAGEDPDDESKCLIKDLDNGTEFVVKESRVSELRTGRQLTMEEFELCVGRSPIVQELMRRQRNVEDSGSNAKGDMLGINGIGTALDGSGQTNTTRTKKRSSWFKSIKSMGSGHRDRRSSDERDTSSEKGGRRSSSATDDSQDGSSHTVQHGPEKAKVRYYGKSHREITGLYMNQEIRAHTGSIWSIKFSLDGRYLASAGEDCVIHVWEVSELDKRGEFFGERESNGSCNPFVAAVTNGSPEPGLGLGLGLNDMNHNHWEKKRRARGVGGRKSASLDHIMVPEHVFALSEKPVCSFRGHSGDVLDLSWSKSQYLLSSSMDKTVRLWHMESNTCLKMFSHSDYVTCIQFNPVDDRYFISGSLDEKVRIWSIPDRQIVDWTDLHEMVTAACYSPDGQSALVGSHKGSCLMYDTSDNKLLQKTQIDLQNKRKKSTQKKVTGFQFAPGSSSKVLITSADSRIRVIDGVDLVHKLKGFRNTSSQITACISANGKYVVSASEDSHVYVWRYDDDSEPGRTKGSVVTCTQSYEYFHCQDVTVAVVWPSPTTVCPTLTADKNGFKPNGENNRTRATWPEEIVNSRKSSPRNNSNADAFINSPVDIFNCGIPAQTRSAWGMVIVTAGRGGEIRTFQNFGFPVRV